MANPEHLQVVKMGSGAIKAWKAENPNEDFDLQGANLQCYDLRQANLSKANLSKADLSKANLSKADLSQANLSEAILYKTNTRGTNLSDTDLTEIKYAERTRYLDTVRLEPDNAIGFSEYNRKWLEKLLGWDILRTVGRLPLFGASYSALILIPIVFYVFALYNENVDVLRTMAGETIALLGELAYQDLNIPESRLYKIDESVHNILKRQPIPNQSFLILISTVFLAIGSTLYTFFCPPRIKEFSQTQWCDQLNGSLLYYWPLAWKHRWARIFCGLFYAIGGVGALWVIGTKVWGAAKFIIENSELPFSLI